MASVPSLPGLAGAVPSRLAVGIADHVFRGWGYSCPLGPDVCGRLELSLGGTATLQERTLSALTSGTTALCLALSALTPPSACATVLATPTRVWVGRAVLPGGRGGVGEGLGFTVPETLTTGPLNTGVQ